MRNCGSGVSLRRGRRVRQAKSRKTRKMSRRGTRIGEKNKEKV